VGGERQRAARARRHRAAVPPPPRRRARTRAGCARGVRAQPHSGAHGGRRPLRLGQPRVRTAGAGGGSPRTAGAGGRRAQWRELSPWQHCRRAGRTGGGLHRGGLHRRGLHRTSGASARRDAPCSHARGRAAAERRRGVGGGGMWRGALRLLNLQPYVPSPQPYVGPACSPMHPACSPMYPGALCCPHGRWWRADLGLSR
jgi:hypothetical protein